MPTGPESHPNFLCSDDYIPNLYFLVTNKHSIHSKAKASIHFQWFGRPGADDCRHWGHNSQKK
jgi:hypothetical protein